MDASAIRAARKRYAANVDSDVVRGYLLQALEGLAEAWDDGLRLGGRLGHEDGWDWEDSPFKRNPYREENQ